MSFPSHFTHRHATAPRPSELAHDGISSRVRARARVHTHVLLAVAVAAIVASGTLITTRSTPSANAAGPAPAATISVRGGSWFALGTSLPAVSATCDFTCAGQPGVANNVEQVDRVFRAMSRSGVSVVRWNLAPELNVTAGVPVSVPATVFANMDAAVRIAAKHDVSLVFVLFPEAAKLPAAWVTVDTQRAALAAALRPMFTRYKSTPTIIGWELTTDVDTLIDAGTATVDQARAFGGTLATTLNEVTTSQLAIARPLDLTRLDTWVGLGFDAYSPPSIGTAGPLCLVCTTPAALAVSEGVDRPVIVGSFATSDASTTKATLRAAAQRGFAGALAQSWTGQPGSVAKPQPKVLRDFAYDTLKAGPVSKPRNPCLGPDATAFRCPNLKMSVPRDISLGRRGTRKILYSTNSVDSVGAGPASIRGTRSGRFTMRAKQLLHRKRGVPMSIATGAKLQFKAIPGQNRYWKWDGAAQMELWRLDSTGRPVELARRGPKTVYCLRDLKRTRGFLARSPRGMVYPGCNRSLKTKAVTLGTSVGWSDVYPASYFENWVDVTGLRGCFAYVHVADPTNAIYESNEDDNRSRITVKLPFTGSSAGCPGAKPLPVSGQNGLGY